MRENKFRFWNEKEKTYNDGKSYFLTSEGTVVVQSGYTMATLAEPPIVEQFTGLKDKNGDEIFQGDIVKSIPDGNVYEIDWFDEKCGWFGFGSEIEYTPLCRLKCVIIGNIHETRSY